MTIHAYRRGRGLEEVGLAVALVVAVWLLPRGPLATGLVVAIPLVLAWSALTLHFPARVELDEVGIAFHRYGRAHRFHWNEVSRVRVRRFLVGDRVLVALSPAPAWRGKYWILESIEGFDVLVTALEARARLAR